MDPTLVPFTALQPETRRDILNAMDRRQLAEMIAQTYPQAPRHWLTRQIVTWLVNNPKHTTLKVTSE